MSTINSIECLDGDEKTQTSLAIDKLNSQQQRQPRLEEGELSYTQHANKALVRKQDLRILPLSAFLYFVLSLDRANVGNAKTLNADTHNDLLSETGMSSYDYTIALMVFLIAYALFEVPSNYFLKRFSPAAWISFLMFSWGAISMGMAGVHSFASFTATRFFLGVFEAGLLPGVIYHLTFWYLPHERSVRIAFVVASATLAGAFGGAIAFGVGHMNGMHHLSGFRWLFILEGLPTCLTAILIYLLLPSYPSTSSFLSAPEKALAALRSETVATSSAKITWKDFCSVCKEWRLYVHYAMYFGISCPFSSLAFFSPTITAGLGFEGLTSQLMTVPPYAVAYVITVLVSWSADRFNARAIHSAIFAAIGACGFLASALLPPDAYESRYGCLIVATSGAFACIPPLLGWLSSNLHSTAHIGLAIALNISWGTPGQITGVWIYKASEKDAGYPTGHWTNCGLLFFVAACCLGLRAYYQFSNARSARVGGGVEKAFTY
ncbi:putative MFS transporter [Saccharata proteae CBS 121410]|uniref:Putative MFS transporter n=1 Tax=Saccharata proteae CBS 121410 TaxID=1314787 RepID=A0A6A5YCX0_9PEZI|nr:putative MFS transporter [Saccharata proteae CBS 121410]